MKTLIQEGRRMKYTNGGGSTIPSGTPVVVGNRVAVACNDIAVGAEGELDLGGVHQLVKVDGTAFGQGDPLYWDSSPGCLTKTSTGNTPAGEAFEDAASDALIARVKLLEGGRVAAHVAKLGVTSDLTAIAASYADEAAARTSVNSLKTEVEARLDAIEAKIDAVIDAITKSGHMAAS